MQPGGVEIAVLDVVERVRRGESVEDDLTELKRDWPDVSKVRQLAGLFNKARGSDVLLVVGLDEKTGETCTVRGEAADWWEQIQARFDEVAPDLKIHLRVPVGDDESVVALVFDTSRAPFVVKVPNATNGVHREIPIRDATGTRTARRHEVLQLLAPIIRAPGVVLIEANLTAEWLAPRGGKGDPGTPDHRPVQPEQLIISGYVATYIEQLTPEFVMIPTRGIQTTAQFGATSLQLKPTIHPPAVHPNRPAPPPRTYGVDPRPEGAMITGPGMLSVHVSTIAPLARLAEIESASSATIKVEYSVSGASIPVRIEGVLQRDSSSTGRHEWDGGRTTSFVFR